MNSIELAELLYAKGHKTVLEAKGLDIEKVLLGYNRMPVNNVELEKIAGQEGYVLTKHGWIKEESLLKLSSKYRKEMIK